MTIFETFGCWESVWSHPALRAAAVLTVALGVGLVIAFPGWPPSPGQLFALFTVIAAPSWLAWRVLSRRRVPLDLARFLRPARRLSMWRR